MADEYGSFILLKACHNTKSNECNVNNYVGFFENKIYIDRKAMKEFIVFLSNS